MERFEDPLDPLNGPTYHTGKSCIEPGCANPAGTHWSRFWCQACNAKRMRHISGALALEVRHQAGEHPIQQVLAKWMLLEVPAMTRRDEVACPCCTNKIRLMQSASLGQGHADCQNCGTFEMRLEAGTSASPAAV